MDPHFHRLSEIPLPLSFSSTYAGSSSSSGSNHDDPWMDPRIWRKLPTRILDRIIAFLPPPAFFRSRCVCRRWNGLLFTNTFLQLYLDIFPHRRHWFLFFKVYTQNLIDDNNNNRAEGYLFDPYELVWYRLPFPLVPPSGFCPAASSGGLVCWISDNPAPKNLLLSNPLSGTLNQLPRTLTSRYQPSIGFTVTPTSIDVTLAGDDLINNALAVKNSSAERFRVDGTGCFLPTWQITSPLPRLCNFESAGRMVHINGRLYNMSYHPFNVATYDVETAIWWDIQPPMKRFLKCPSVVESGTGKLLLVAAIEKRSLIVPKSLRVWSLQEGTTWVEIERMPQLLYDRFGAEMESCGNGFHCVGHGEFIVFMIPGSSRHLGVLFNMNTKLWKCMPPCPFVGMGDLSRGFAYEPRLATPVTSLLNYQFPAAPFPA
ncbi:putative F-box domain, galactose oxidase/kelch, beta-propeller, galactose oxidase, beta-propeller [Rosa chinensis]|uniref:Putative F-box domain, galactose oxidase/kelch, beta-propeller, galactose oxidase, beta-propeller n=1 Tax=Rosa chinensis TaxID=74649 RepID=A0A2P6R7C1_ROSCH|nr:protein UNUSUAL FLORAL ORGANS [Rosa chinensis]PRQ42321.1 putative F-box domain, galactose oxidase/kelch, beta-propeller, galactose oxidase, beta-propeller [Rosa chinensis]